MLSVNKKTKKLALSGILAVCLVFAAVFNAGGLPAKVSAAAFSPAELLTEVSGVGNMAVNQAGVQDFAADAFGSATNTRTNGVRVSGAKTAIGTDSFVFRYKNPVYLDDVNAGAFLFGVSPDSYGADARQGCNYVDVLKFRIIDASNQSKYIEVEFGDGMWTYANGSDNPSTPQWTSENARTNAKVYVKVSNGAGVSSYALNGDAGYPAQAGYSLRRSGIWSFAAPTIKYNPATNVITAVGFGGTNETMFENITFDLASKLPGFSFNGPVILEVSAQTKIGNTSLPAAGVVVSALAGVSLSGAAIEPAYNENMRLSVKGGNVIFMGMGTKLAANAYDIVYGVFETELVAVYKGADDTGANVTSQISGGYFTPAEAGVYTLKFGSNAGGAYKTTNVNVTAIELAQQNALLRVGNLAYAANTLTVPDGLYYSYNIYSAADTSFSKPLLNGDNFYTFSFETAGNYVLRYEIYRDGLEPGVFIMPFAVGDGGAPVITLSSNYKAKYTTGAELEIIAATAVDSGAAPCAVTVEVFKDGNAVSFTGGKITLEEGSYKIVYSAADSGGLTGTKTVEFTVGSGSGGGCGAIQLASPFNLSGLLLFCGIFAAAVLLISKRKTVKEEI